MANTTIDTLSVSNLQNLISLKEHEYKEAIKKDKPLEEVKKILKEKKELEKELAKMENKTN